MTDFLYTDARWTERFVEVNDPHKEGHHVRFYFEPQQRTWVGLTNEERLKLYRKFEDCLESDGWEYEKAIEAKLKEKNNDTKIHTTT
jgi:hypothetical protein